MTDSKTKTVTLKVGQKAPDFTLKNQKGQIVTLSEELKYNKVLLVFYPSDMTPGCTAQLCGIRDIYQDYRDIGVKVFGVNQGDEKSHQKFIDKHSYQFDILVDIDRKIATEFGQLGSFFGRPKTSRGVYLIDNDGTVIYTKQGQQDNQEIIDFVKNR